MDVELYVSISSTLLRTLYGYNVESSTDPLISRAQKLIVYLTSTMLTSNFMREASKWRKEKESLMNETFNIGMKCTENKNKRPLVASIRAEALNLELTEEYADDYAKISHLHLLRGEQILYLPYCAMR
ncbi:hypothetical protein RSOLAG1IB_01108 [Rhizoctonia solani AG-1 IB]|uniref:Uncharacterized protein n=1 Tax=Thanatephorus cucumeris (strain AG1-IB / isolate 7/3/14) TaxID=1108050 RepID=A0A0B7FC38_THACB|nr:hypothetical protein RSOLAG1IB_01108 [Rhizoctonia solani AG-1 IB]